MTDVRRIFVDTNIITRATIDAAPLHEKALQQLDQLWEADVELYISQQVIREYMVNATRLQTYSPALSMPDVLKQVQNLRESFFILHDAPGTLDKLLELAGQVTMNGKQIHDSNIVATMLAHGITELFTHNVSDFVRYQHLITVIAL